MSADLLLQQLNTRNSEPIVLDKPVEVAQLATPALVLDRALMLSNMRKMAAHVQHHDKGFRPHSKTHKCPSIAQMQIEQGAVGICAAKLSEAAVMLAAGVNSVLITSPLATLQKAQVLNALLAQHPDHELRLVVDSIEGMDVLHEAIGADQQLGLLVDIDLSMGRTGTRDVETMLALVDSMAQEARKVVSLLGAVR